MHFLKLFLASTFAVDAVVRTISTIFGKSAALFLASMTHIPSTTFSFLGGMASALAGAMIARHLHYRNVPKADHD